VLRQQLKAIQEELGEFDESAEEAGELREQLHAIELPADVRKQADRELNRLEHLPPAAAEHGVIRTYLEWIASLPWDRATADRLDLTHARAVLDEDHYDIAQVKERILEFLAVRKLKPDARGSILCFVGPPGVGKTSLGRSIAKALGREFERISPAACATSPRSAATGARTSARCRDDHPRAARRGLEQPAVHDRRDRQDGRGLPRRSGQRDARGPRPGAERRVPRPLPRRAVRPVERHVHHDGQHARHDPGPLRDRMEVIQLAGYTADDKLQIAKRYLVPRQIERNGLKKSWIAISDAALRAIISDYTREAGVRGLEREIGTLCRKIAFSIASEAEGGRVRKTTVGEARRASCSAASGSSPRRAGAPSSPGWPPGWPGPPSVATCCSSRRPQCRPRRPSS
jgi:ATP-dependent Lon protease